MEGWLRRFSVESDENLLILDRYPAPIADGYKEVKSKVELGPSAAAATNELIRHWAETCLRYIAVLAWSEYRYRSGAPNEAIEAVVRAMKKPSFGQWLQLWRMCNQVVSSSILDIKVLHSARDSNLQRAAALGLVLEGFDHALRFEVPGPKLGDFLNWYARSRQLPKTDQGQFWGAVVALRNNLSHRNGQTAAQPIDPSAIHLVNEMVVASMVEALIALPALHTHMWCRPAEGRIELEVGPDRTELRRIRLEPRYYTREQITLRTPHRIEVMDYLVKLDDHTLYAPFPVEAGPSLWDEAPIGFLDAPPVAAAPDGELIRQYEALYLRCLEDDGVVSPAERGVLNALAQASRLTPEQVQQTEEQAATSWRASLRANEPLEGVGPRSHQAEPAGTDTAAEASGEVAWRQLSGDFLRHVMRRVLPHLSFLPAWTEPELDALDTYASVGATQVHFLAIGVGKKYKENISVWIVFRSKAKRRDPAYREARAAVLEHEDGDLGHDWWLEEEAESLSAAAQKRVTIAHLTDKTFIKEVAATFCHLSALVANNLNGVTSRVA